jgi:thiol-disulfide isomerase/thioredoxin
MEMCFCRKAFKGILFFFCLLSVSLQVAAQTNDFYGKWVLKERTSLSGVDYENGLAKQLKVVQKNDSIIIERLNVDANGSDYTINESMSLNGNPAIIVRPGNRKRTSAIKFSDDHRSIVETVNYYKANSDNEIDFTFTEVWNYNQSSKSFELKKTQKNSNGEIWSMKGVYVSEAEYTSELGQGIQFFQASNWQDVKAKAKRENKFIFVDCFATWCGPCKQMEKNIFPLNMVGTEMNNSFISVKLQMDTTQKDDDKIKEWYPVAHEFLTKYNLAGYPSYLFFDSDGNIVHQGLGTYKGDEFISLLKAARDPGKQYYPMLDNYQKGHRDYEKLPYLATTAQKLGEKKLANEMMVDYKNNFLRKLPFDSLLSKKYLSIAYVFPSLLIGEDGSAGIFFKLFYEKSEDVDHILNHPGYSDFNVNAIVTVEEIQKKIYINKKPISNPSWEKIKSTIQQKYSKLKADSLVLSAKIEYYETKKEWSNQIKYLVKKIDQYGPLSVGMLAGQGSDNTIASALLPHCEDPQILNKAVGWMEKIIYSKAYKYPVPMVYGNYGALLYKAGKQKEGIEAFEKQLNALGYKTPADLDKHPDYKPKVEILEKMKRGEKMDSTWDITAFF